MYLHSFLDYWAREQPEAEFMVMGQQQVTYAQTLSTVNQLATAFINLNLKLGDRIAILSKNRVEYIFLYLAASKVGIVPVPLNFRLTAPQWRYIINDAQAKMLVCSADYVQPLQAIRHELKSINHFVCLDDVTVSGWQAYRPWVADQALITIATHFDEQADLYQMYTSGTTGQPKGAILTQRAVTANLGQIAAAHRGQPGERSLAMIPLFHAGVVPTVFAPMSWGGAAYIMDSFDPLEVVRVLSQERIGFATMIPTIIQTLLLSVPDIDSHRYEHLRTIYYGSSPITSQTLQRAMDVFPCDFIQSYGLTEATQAVTFLMPADHQRAMSGQPELLLSAGRPALGTEVQIVDHDDNPVPNNTSGEVVIRGPQVMSAYWNRAEESAMALRHDWLHTGDAGMMDDEGFIYVQDRIKDTIVSGGENVYPTIVENALSVHPAVAEVAVIGVPHERWGETVKAIVVLRPDCEATEEDLINFCRDKLAGFERPRSVDLVAELPHNASGKVLKRILRDPYWAGQQRRVAGV